jgi:hypothetical protein
MLVVVREEANNTVCIPVMLEEEERGVVVGEAELDLDVYSGFSGDKCSERESVDETKKVMEIEEGAQRNTRRRRHAPISFLHLPQQVALPNHWSQALEWFCSRASLRYHARISRLDAGEAVQMRYFGFVLREITSLRFRA